MSKDILEVITESAAVRVKKAKETLPLRTMIKLAKEKTVLTKSNKNKFLNALSLENKNKINLICEIKKASPSKGVIDDKFDYLKILSDYESGGAAAISILTEPEYFLGSNEIFSECRKNTSLPLLRKDFVIDEYMIYEAKVLGADAVLLIVKLLTKEKLKEYLSLCESLNLNALIETHGESEIELALEAGGNIIGVNNRNLNDFSVDTDNAIKLKKHVPHGKIFVAESGINNAEDTKALKAAGINSALVGEACMKAKWRTEFVKNLINIS